MSRRNVWVPQEDWDLIEQAAIAESSMKGKQVSVSEILRRGARKEAHRIVRVQKKRQADAMEGTTTQGAA